MAKKNAQPAVACGCLFAIPIICLLFSLKALSSKSDAKFIKASFSICKQEKIIGPGI